MSGLEAETGGHRIQAVSPTEKRGRIHTSTVMVAILDKNIGTSELYNRRSESDFHIEFFSGTGKGGQHRNRHMCSCRIVHIPTGITKISQTRSRVNSQKNAMDEILKSLDNLAFCEYTNKIGHTRKNQLGSGMRGDKSRTYREQDDTVLDHRTGKSGQMSKILKGYFDLLW